MTSYYLTSTAVTTSTSIPASSTTTYDTNYSTKKVCHASGSTELSIKDANGRHISLLNDHAKNSTVLSAKPQCQKDTSVGRRKYRCTKLGCNKIFTTSGHLSRHYRIHTGEKNFQCLYPGCPSRFSRQDNMMQHYRTHMSPRSRRLPWKPSMADVAADAAAAAVKHYYYQGAMPEPTATIDCYDDLVRLPELQLFPPLHSGESHRRESKMVGHDYYHHQRHQHHYRKPQPMEPPSPPTTPTTATSLLHLPYFFTNHSRFSSSSSSFTELPSEYLS